MRALPSECFASPVGGDAWRALASGAPAHWLAHELGVRAPIGRPACAAGFAIERRDLVGRRRPIASAPRRGDLWVDLDDEGCGVVAGVSADSSRGLSIAIRHLHPLPARAALGDFYLQMNGRGSFFR